MNPVLLFFLSLYLLLSPHTSCLLLPLFSLHLLSLTALCLRLPNVSYCPFPSLPTVVTLHLLSLTALCLPLPLSLTAFFSPFTYAATPHILSLTALFLPLPPASYCLFSPFTYWCPPPHTHTSCLLLPLLSLYLLLPPRTSCLLLPFLSLYLLLLPHTSCFLLPFFSIYLLSPTAFFHPLPTAATPHLLSLTAPFLPFTYSCHPTSPFSCCPLPFPTLYLRCTIPHLVSLTARHSLLLSPHTSCLLVPLFLPLPTVSYCPSFPLPTAAIPLLLSLTVSSNFGSSF